jgi:metal-responsive CopG/Arc/MetJ family transcriptional regulator
VTRWRYNASNMKTIAFTIDDETLARLDRVRGNRSKLIREAVREHLARRDRLASEQQEARIVHRHRGRLARQARALVRSQAKP